MKISTLKALLYSLIFAVVLTIFPAVSGVIVVIEQIGTIQGYLLQGTFMMFSILIPNIFMRFLKIKPHQIGLVGIKKAVEKQYYIFFHLLYQKRDFSFLG